MFPVATNPSFQQSSSSASVNGDFRLQAAATDRPTPTPATHSLRYDFDLVKPAATVVHYRGALAMLERTGDLAERKTHPATT